MSKKVFFNFTLFVKKVSKCYIKICTIFASSFILRYSLRTHIRIFWYLVILVYRLTLSIPSKRLKLGSFLSFLSLVNFLIWAGNDLSEYLMTLKNCWQKWVISLILLVTIYYVIGYVSKLFRTLFKWRFNKRGNF